MRILGRIATAVVILVLLAVVGWAVIRQIRARRSRATAPTQTVIRVTTRPAVLTELASAISVTGTVEPDRKVMLASQIPGKVAAVTADEGDRVSAGQVLVRLDDSDLRVQVAQAQAAVQAAQAAQGLAQSRLDLALAGARPQERVQVEQAVRQAKAGLDNAEAELKRSQDLFDRGAISAQQLDLARTQEKVAQSQYRSAQEQLSLVREGARPEDIQAAREQVRQTQAGIAQAASALEAAQATLAKTVIRSPLGGAVSQREVDPGQTVMPGQTLVEVVDNRQVYVKAKVSESEVRRVRPGQQAAVRVDAYADRNFAGRVRDILPAAEVETRMFYVRVQVANPQGNIRRGAQLFAPTPTGQASGRDGTRPLRPGMFARCEITTARFSGTAVPRQAVLREGESASVFVVQGGKARRVQVELGIEQGDLVQAVSGISPGDEVVTSGQHRLRDGVRVTVAGGA